MRARPSGAAVTLIAASGPGPFVTRRVYLVGDRPVVWHARAHRKGLRVPFAGVWPPLRAMLWSPLVLNWWIGMGFAFGALLFAAGSVLALGPGLPGRLGLSGGEARAVYFVGSIFFTGAAYLQLFQAANAGEAIPAAVPHRGRQMIGWRPGDIGWLGSALQFLGTLLFNVSTFEGIVETGGWLRQDLTILAPDVVGSVLFLASGYLAFLEACHHHWVWQPESLTWWIVATNLLGCVAFMMSAVFAVMPGALAVTLSVGFTLLGAVMFLIGAVLLLPEGTGAAAGG